MVSIKNLFFLILLLNGCAKVSYLWDQGRGQLKILTKARDNQDVLKDVRVRPEYKEKIRQIQVYKKYFYEYWQKKPAEIYEKTYFLEQDAVTYLVVASPFDKIEARKECFPMMGCFPYLGFFSQQKAKDFAHELEEENWVTYTRPVYAYSSLGYFSDPILSSFFHYNQRQLADLVFHELFHTIFFARDEVNFNENLANYFAKSMVMEYFKDDEVIKEKMQRNAEEQKKLNRKIVKLVKELNEKYNSRSKLNKEGSKELFDQFIETRFRPELKALCTEQGIKHCKGLERNWNNASFVAFLTYEEQESKIASLQKELGLQLKQFFSYIVGKYQDFEESSSENDFEQYLFDKKTI